MTMYANNFCNDLNRYVSKILRNICYWESISINSYIFSTNEKGKVELEIICTLAKQKYLKSCRRMALRIIKEKLEEDLGIKAKDINLINPGVVIMTDKGTKSIPPLYGVSACISYIISDDLFSKLDALVAIDDKALSNMVKENTGWF